MAHKLADEILKEILSPPLLVPDEMFADNATVSPFSNAEMSASNVLLVCKRWMRVATPYLYQTVIVRSMPQAKALALALSNNPDFGQYIRKLRIEGGYGDTLCKVADTATFITDLCFTLTLWSDMGVGGLVKILKVVNPQRVILTLATEARLKNKNHDRVLTELCFRVPQWDRITVFQFADTYRARDRRWISHVDYLAYPELRRAIASSPSLHEIRIAQNGYARTVIPTELDAVQQLMCQPTVTLTLYPLKHLIYNVEWRYEHILSRLPNTLQPRFKLRLSDSDSSATMPEPLRTSDSEIFSLFFWPLQGGTPEFREATLRRIIEYALYLNQTTFSATQWRRDAWFDSKYFDCAMAVSLLAVNREFRSMTRRILVRHVRLWSMNVASEPTQQLLDNSGSLLKYTRTINFTRWGNHHPTVEQQLAFLTNTPNLIEATIYISPSIIQCLVNTGSARSLRRLEISGVNDWPADRQTELRLDIFPSLEHLSLNWGFKDWEPGPVPTTDWAQPVELASLRRLTVRDFLPEVVMLRLSSYVLPRWTKLEANTWMIDRLRFLVESQGRNLQHIQVRTLSSWIWEAAPAMEVLELHDQIDHYWPAVREFESAAHQQLKELLLHTTVITVSGRKRQKLIDEEWKKLLTTAISRAQFPSLEKIRLLQGDALWPVNERELKKSIWPAIAEHLQDEGIVLLDKNGRGWRRRLQ